MHKKVVWYFVQENGNFSVLNWRSSSISNRTSHTANLLTFLGQNSCFLPHKNFQSRLSIWIYLIILTKVKKQSEKCISMKFVKQKYLNLFEAGIVYQKYETLKNFPTDLFVENNPDVFRSEPKSPL